MKEYKLPLMLKELLKENEMKQIDLANKLNANPKSIYEWIHEITCPSISSLMCIADIFDVSLDYLVYGEPK